MNDKELQKEFINFLAQKSGAKTEEELNKYIKSLSKELQAKLKEEFATYMLNKAKKAAKGAKLDYIKKLSHKCPEGFELYYYKKGGSVGCGCKGKKLEDGGKADKKESVISKFKNRKVKSISEGSKIKKDKVCPKCGKIHAAGIGCSVAKFKMRNG